MMNSKNLWILNHYANPPDLPGGTRHYDLASRLADQGYTVTLFCSNYHHKLRRYVRQVGRGGYLLERIGGLNFVWIQTPPYPGNNWKRILNMAVYALRVIPAALRLVRRKELERPAVILGSSVHLLAVLSAYLLSRLLGAKFIMEIRDLWPQTLVDVGVLRESSPLTFLLRRLEAFLYKKAEVIITLLPEAASYLEKFGVPASQVVWIPNGVELSRYSQAEDPPEKGDFEVLYLGNLGLNALPILIQAARIIQDSGPGDIRFAIVGEGHYKSHYQALAGELGLENLSFEPAIPKLQVPERLAAADVLVSVLRDLDLYQYGISLNKLFDYLAAARPVILTGNPVNNIVAEAGCGRTAPPDDPQALADAILDLYHLTSAERLALGSKGRAYVEEHHDIRVLARRLGDAIESLD